MATTTTKKTPKRAPAGGKAKNPTTRRAAPAKAPKLKGGAAKLAWIQQQIRQHVEKTGRNTHHNYDYFQEHGVLSLVKPLLEQIGAGVLISWSGVERSGNHTWAICDFTVYDAELSQESADWGITAHIPCEATDSQDKASNKLMTAGAKYAYQKVFLIPTEGLLDPDDTESGSTDSTGEAKAAAPKQINARKAATLRATAAQAVEDNKLDNKAVTAFLTATFGKNKITELTAEEGEQFATWLTEKIGG